MAIDGGGNPIVARGAFGPPGHVLAFEEGFATGDFPDAVLLKVMDGKRTELARGQLSESGGVAVGRAAGHVLVTDGTFSSGRF